jgi:hypothetical protein
MGLSSTIAAGSRQRSHSQVRVPRDSWPHFIVSDSRLLQLGGPGPRIYIPQEQGARLYPQALGSLFIASYDSQGYGGGIRPGLHTKPKSHCDWRSVCLSWCRDPAGAHDQMFLLVWKLLSCPCGAHSLTRRRVCHLSVIVGSISPASFVQLFTILLLKPNRMYNMYKVSVSPGSVQQTMPYF